METGPILDTKMPEFKLPPAACDAQIHLMGPAREYPFADDWKDRGYDATEEMLTDMHDVIGCDRCVIVHGRPHLYDLRVTLAALAKKPDRYRAVALLDPDIEHTNLRELHEAGFRGVRFNLMGGTPDLDKMGNVVEQIAPYGWHVCFHMASGQIIEYEDWLKGLDVEIVFDHVLRIDPADGLDQAPMIKLCEFLDAGLSWIKLSAFERMSHKPYPHDDILPFAAALLEAFPERALWATDWPHNLFGPDGPPEDGSIVDLIPMFASSTEHQRLMLVDNPARLYDFS